MIGNSQLLITVVMRLLSLYYFTLYTYVKFMKIAFSTNIICQFQSTYENQVRAPPQESSEALVLLDENGRYTRFVNNSCGSVLFHRYQEGHNKRMGQDWIPNKAISLTLLLYLSFMLE